MKLLQLGDQLLNLEQIKTIVKTADGVVIKMGLGIETTVTGDSESLWEFFHKQSESLPEHLSSESIPRE